MKKLLIQLILISLSFVSCKRKENINVTQSKEVQNKEIIVNEEQYVENDSLVVRMEDNLNELLNNSNFKIEKELTENRHVDNLKDTLVTYKFDKTYIKTYKTISEEWAFEAIIQNPEFKLLKFLKIGIDKKSFEKIINQTISSDIVKVGNLEQTSVFEFKFNNDYLKEINFEGYVD